MTEENEVKDVNGVSAAALLGYIERIERLEEEKKALSKDIKGLFEQAKYNDKIDPLALREILKMRKKDERERIENEFIVEQYKIALGMG